MEKAPQLEREPVIYSDDEEEEESKGPKSALPITQGKPQVSQASSETVEEEEEEEEEMEEEKVGITGDISSKFKAKQSP
jgi:hypothetical protein